MHRTTAHAVRLRGVRSQLNKLRASIHPVTFEKLPQATLVDGGSLTGAGVYSRLKVLPPRRDFVPYQPEIFPPSHAPAQYGKSAAVKIKLRLAQVRLKAKARRKMVIEAEAADAIATFGQESSDDEESRQFWHGLADIENRDIFKHTASKPDPCRGTKQQQSRAVRLTLS